MKLKQVTIKNYKSCNETKLDLNDGVTALIGINGAGKTNILTAINAFKAPQIESLSQYHDGTIVGTEIFAQFEVENTIVHLKLTRSFAAQPGVTEEVLYVWKIDNLLNGKWVFIPLWAITNPIDKLKTKLYLQQSQEIETDDNELEQYLKFLLLVKNFISSIVYYPVPLFLSGKNPVNGMIDMSIQLENDYEIFLKELYNCSKSDVYDRYMNLVGKNGIGLIDSIKFFEINKDFKECEENEKVVFLLPSVMVGRKGLTFNQLSEGTFRTLALLFYLIKSDEGLILLEEPEVCIHHGLLQTIIELIKNESENKQIVFSTHSDFVLDQLHPEDLIFVENGTEGTKAKRLTDTLSKNDYNALRTYLDETGNLGEYWKEGGFEN